MSTSSSAPSPLPKFIYKILPNTSRFQGTPTPIPSGWTFPSTALDANDGFIHLSTLSQLLGTLNRFFAPETEDGKDGTVLLVKVDLERLSAWKIVKWEKSGSGGVFPHLYGADLEGEYVRGLKIVERGEGEKGWDVAVEVLKKDGWLEE
ncbi:hypothetical protein SISNIDRAFT_459422 [Sistotremastrum niveocremeum HHB9708]|uniref:DUF952-domain-containing protein n=2 Tax=Sistotremastraceae TaxID=3402574 RepID=A0A164PK24_9AGAM|nr:hypothetical protein SISNIDRAFT_459422 [Sistotremastrum niveocremeum HHB9708]KZT35819.1 hypothetical protein SISSUDRAFT_1050834 [Sistotremastrum suecicum HHB10207 ss-3]